MAADANGRLTLFEFQPMRLGLDQWRKPPGGSVEVPVAPAAAALPSQATNLATASRNEDGAADLTEGHRANHRG